ncbi:MULTISPECIES: hypothetical protein [unclassified Haematospirillum]|uniref:hypothetical protein n=1 Tax=unclassified Haematospirillum TaxID=2622088 RepID=UPI00143B9225|nr:MULTISPECIES: hypothetical protein [unclassified Haematospirillum]NKD55869.1 hypothetical protein [Haematospirillum sp. H4890]NKD75924.1 hypothetical protein [Haematospirillum sp. H4485]NKD88790.1 hypothetical protein [Haematospirillum sp. 15-248]
MKSKVIKIASVISLAAISSLHVSGAHATAAKYGTCFELKPIEFVKVHGNNSIIFKVEGNETRYKLIDGTNTTSGKSMHQMLMLSVATRSRVTGYSDDVNCGGDLVKSIVSYNR